MRISKDNREVLKMKKKAQSEMVGFAIIIVIVAVLILVFLSISLNKSKDDFTESYEVESFIQASLEYTTDCAINYEPNYQNVRRLIFRCINGENCLGERDSCEVLNETLKELVELSWNVGPEWPDKGYFLEIVANNESLLKFSEGNVTQTSKGSKQPFSQGLTGNKGEIFFEVHN
jgi:hypothetical protein